MRRLMSDIHLIRLRLFFTVESDPPAVHPQKVRHCWPFDGNWALLAFHPLAHMRAASPKLVVLYLLLLYYPKEALQEHHSNANELKFVALSNSEHAKCLLLYHARSPVLYKTNPYFVLFQTPSNIFAS